MIIKPYDETTPQKDRRQRAGAVAEKQVAHYLHRAFRDDEEVFVLHDLRIQDQDQPEQDGSPGVCQIDHLVVYRRGFFIIESKSVAEKVRVRSDGSGGDEWIRVYRGKETGMPSPIRQAQRQSDFLRTFLQRQRDDLLGKQPLGLRTIAKVAAGTDQRGFKHAPIQLVIAISDRGNIERVDGWEEPRDPFQVFVAKADLVPDKISQELKAHRKGAGSDYGVWGMEEGEARKVADFLVAHHVERRGAPPVRPKKTTPDRNCKGPQNESDGAGHSAGAACKHCGSKDLDARWKKYGYYWACRACQKNTAMPVECSSCGAKKGQGNKVRIRKDKETYFRDCKACGTTEVIWTGG